MLQWNDDLVLGMREMDDTHMEFVELLAKVEAANDEDILAAWIELIAHTHVHFANEDMYMAATNFAAGNCHTSHHKMILDVMREGMRKGQEGDLQVIRDMAAELAIWFPFHADSMDAALANHLQKVGFDAASMSMSNPPSRIEKIHGCGGDECSE